MNLKNNPEAKKSLFLVFFFDILSHYVESKISRRIIFVLFFLLEYQKIIQTAHFKVFFLRVSKITVTIDGLAHSLDLNSCYFKIY